jgi:tol-pal system protein YbgF
MRQLRGLINEAHRHTEEVRKDVAELKQWKETLATLDFKLQDFERRLTTLEGKSAATSVETADALYEAGMKAYKEGDYANAHNYFKRLVIRFPGHDRADDALYYRGEAYFAEKDYDSAIREYQQIFDKYDKSPLADDAMYRAGEAAEELKRCTEARAYYGLLLQKHPRSSMAKKAKKRSADLKKYSKNKKKCLN